MPICRRGVATECIPDLPITNHALQAARQNGPSCRRICGADGWVARDLHNTAAHASGYYPSTYVLSRYDDCVLLSFLLSTHPI